MNKVSFVKMHGAGNDFIMIDDRDGTFPAADRRRIAPEPLREIGLQLLDRRLLIRLRVLRPRDPPAGGYGQRRTDGQQRRPDSDVLQGNSSFWM